jgi:hypothetical protein
MASHFADSEGDLALALQQQVDVQSPSVLLMAKPPRYWLRSIRNDLEGLVVMENLRRANLAG